MSVEQQEKSSKESHPSLSSNETHSSLSSKEAHPSLSLEEAHPSLSSQEESKRRKLILKYHSLCKASQKMSKNSKKKQKVLKALKRKMSQLHAENILLKRTLEECLSTEQYFDQVMSGVVALQGKV